MMITNSWLFGGAMLSIGVVLVASQLPSALDKRSLWHRLRYLLSATLTGGEAGEGRIAGAGFAGVISGLVILAASAYNLLAR